MLVDTRFIVLMHYAMSFRKLFESFHGFSEQHGVDSRQRSKIIDEDTHPIVLFSILVHPELRVHVL